jgi:hypothetical protein
MDDPINEMPAAEWRIFAAALYLFHHPEITGMAIYRTTGERYGLSAANAHEALSIRDAYRYGWPPKRRWP